MTKQRLISLLLAFLVLSTAVSAQKPATTILSLGQPAPPLRSSYWIQGTPVINYQKGKVYVIEFWATWCVYCIKAMPHLSQLAKQYAGRVEIIGVDVLETAPWGKDKVEYNRKKITDFLKSERGKALTYSACRDTNDDYFANNWITAQALYGVPAQSIPFTVLIDQAGNVAWIGHPMADDFDKTIAELVAGTYDLQAFIQQTQHRRAQYEQTVAETSTKQAKAVASAALQPMNDALVTRQYNLALKEAYRAIESDPSLYRVTYLKRLDAFTQLATTNPAQVQQWLEQENQTASIRNDTTHAFLRDVATSIGNQQGLSPAMYQFAIVTLKDVPNQRILAIRHLKGLAAAYYHEDKAEKAQEVIQYLIRRIKEMGSDPSEYEKLLEVYRLPAR